MRRVGIGAALVVAGACAVGGCSLLPAQSVSDTTTLDQSVTSIKLDGHSGSVEVNGQTGATKVTVERTIKYRDQRPNQDAYQVTGGVLTLTGDCGSDCDVDYVVTVPAGLAVGGGTSSGHIALHHVGAVDVKTSTGSVELADVTGTVKAETSNGAIEGTGLRGGAVQATTSNGEIDLTLADANNVTARTSNGRIQLTVPSSATYRVSGNSSNGHRRIGVDDDASGKYSLDLNTDNGSIEVDKA
ncbi:DUF4097 family beta strand repeat-containing protein [Kutzneria buriramensis]|uniref:Putative adhesin n=1 Tax=Kutzneria buriramensis TaxID=1045776 RepID=A0A3E0HRB8_9PSEU|nr:DUF4097 family beta strand repeat-containing protein [Kutzneria buriramensis]REH48535.1 putative adhesin [Kutzneria buriramensis]